MKRNAIKRMTYYSAQGGYENRAKHLKWSFLRKYLTAFNHSLFSQNNPSLMFDWVLNNTTPAQTLYLLLLRQNGKNLRKNVFLILHIL